MHHVEMVTVMRDGQRLPWLDKNPVKAAQHALCAVIAGVEILEEHIAAVENANPNKAICNEWLAKLDAVDDLLRDAGSKEERDRLRAQWDAETKRLHEEWKAEGSSDRLYEECKHLYDEQKALTAMLHEAERDLLIAYRAHFPFPPHTTDITNLIDEGIAGKLYRGSKAHPGPMDKLVSVCMHWDTNGAR